MLDGNSRQNLATFCQTWAEPEVHKLMDECMDKNMIDKDEYSANGGNRGALCPYVGRSLELTGSGQHRGLLDDRFQRGGHARWHGDEASLGGQAQGCR